MTGRVQVRGLEGRQLLGVARTHALVTDRPAPEGGTDRREIRGLRARGPRMSQSAIE